MSKKIHLRYFMAYALVLILITILTLRIFSLEAKSAQSIVVEGGPIETLSAILYFLCFGFICVMGRFTFLRQHTYLALVPLLFGLRELDAHKEFTTTGIFKIRFFTSAEVPFYEKFFGFLLVAALIYMVVALVRHQTKNYFAEVRLMTPLAIGPALVVGLAVFSKTIDGLGRKLDSFGYTISNHALATFGEIEEIMELGIPMIMIIAFTYFFLEKNPPPCGAHRAN